MISNNLIEIASFSHPYEAHIAKASLETADIPVFITDEHTINMQWLYSDALGGIRLLVPKGYEIEAKVRVTNISLLCLYFFSFASVYSSK